MATIVFVIGGIAFAFFKIQNALTKGGIRIPEEEELAGADIEMGVVAYPEFDLVGGGARRRPLSDPTVPVRCGGRCSRAPATTVSRSRSPPVVSHALLDILIVLVAAKVAAELMERINVPAVVGEILAGILIGPSGLDLVENSDVLRVLAEIGVILLLLEVGSELELERARRRRQGVAAASRSSASRCRSSAAPRSASSIGMSGNEALFVGAALTATSVGITARVLR